MTKFEYLKPSTYEAERYQRWVCETLRRVSGIEKRGRSILDQFIVDQKRPKANPWMP